MKKFLTILLASLLLLGLVGCGKEETESKKENEAAVNEESKFGYFLYNVNADGDYEITGFDYTEVEKIDVEVPSEIGGRPVTGIGDEAFKALKNIKSVAIPTSVTYIGAHAFYDCDYLTEIVLPDSVVTLGTGAFENCSGLEKVTLSKSLKTLGAFSFKDCAKLGNVTLPDGLLTVEEGAFMGCTSMTAVTVPTSVTALGNAVFYGCASLSEITVSGDVSQIGTILLDGCADGLAVHAKEGSAFEKYAQEQGYLEIPEAEEDAAGEEE